MDERTERTDAAQRCWEAARAIVCPERTAAFALWPETLELIAQQPWNSLEVWCKLVVNDRCPPSALLRAADGNGGFVELAAALHDACPPDAAGSLLAENVEVLGARYQHGVLARLSRPLLDIVAAAFDRFAQPVRGAIADGVALADSGFLTGVERRATAAWLTDRNLDDFAASPTMTGTSGPLLPALARRSDLDDTELRAVLHLATRAGDIFLKSVAARPLPLEAALLAVKLACATTSENAVFQTVLRLVLRDRPPGDMVQLLGTFSRYRTWTPYELQELWMNCPDVELVRDELLAAAGRDVPGELARWSDDSQLARRLDLLLTYKASAPRPLHQLDAAQLAVFAELAPRWRGTLGQLIAVADRAS